jgi:type I restriction enzyme S subunit
VCKVQGGFAFKSQEYEKSGVPLVRISNLVNGKVCFDSDTVYLPASKLDVHKDFVLKRGDTLIAMSGATTGKMATFDMDSPALLNQRVGRFRILSEEACNPRFIALLVQQITRQVLKEAYGAAQPNISPTQIEQISIPFPPLDEQREIVAEVEKQFTRLEAGVAGLRRVKANLKRYRAAVLKAACEGKLVPTEAELARQEGRTYETGAQLLERILAERRQKSNGKGKYKEPAKPDTDNLPQLPEDWMWVCPEQLADFGDNAIVLVHSEQYSKPKISDLTEFRLFSCVMSRQDVI